MQRQKKTELPGSAAQVKKGNTKSQKLPKLHQHYTKKPM